MRQRRQIRQLFLVLAIGAASILPAVNGGSAASAGGAPSSIKVRRGVTQPVFSYADAVRETVYVESLLDTDGKPGKDLLATDIIRPKVSGGLKVPAIYEQSPYYQLLGRGNESEIKHEEDGDYVPEFFPLFYDNYFVPRGYAVIHQDMPGTRNSEGCLPLGGNAELAAAKATIKWLRGKGKAFRFDPLTGLREEIGPDDPSHPSKWSAGKVGMIGKSYDGTIANAAASMGVKGLKTIVPIGAISRWYDYMWNRGVQYTGNTGTSPLFTYVIDQTPPDDEERKAEWAASVFGETAKCEIEGTAIVARADSEDHKTPFWHERDYLHDPKERPSNIAPEVFPSRAKNVKASVFVVHGVNDWNVKPNQFEQWWNALSRAGVPRKMWLAQVGHVDPFDFRRNKWVRTLHRWFDRWLHGIDNGIMSEPMVDIERGVNRWRRYGSWPAKNARRMRLWLGPATKKLPGTLTRRRPGKKDTQTYTDTYPSESTMTSDPKEKKQSRIIFLSKKLKRGVRISGRMVADIRASVDRIDTNFTLLLVDYGKALRVDHEGSGDGIRETDRESCHGATHGVDDACYIKTVRTTAIEPIEIVDRGWLAAKHRKNLGRDHEFLNPGETYRFRWRTFGEDYIFQKGHRIGVVISGSDRTFTNPNPQQDANVEVKLRRSRVVFRVAGGVRALRRATR